MAKTKRRKLYEKARNILRNNTSLSRGASATAAGAPDVIRAFHKFQESRSKK